MPESKDDVDELEVGEGRQSRRKEIGRAALGGVLGLVLLVVPIFIANTVIGGEAPSDATSAAPSTVPVSNAEFRALRNQSTAAPTTTTTAPPPPPTTAPPPPPPTTTTTAPPTTTTTAAPAPVTADSGGGVSDPYSYATWDTLAQCESGGNWSINTGNGYYGGVQFSLSSWQAVGGSGYPHEASRETQITMAIRLWEAQGWAAWPACTAELGWR